MSAHRFMRVFGETKLERKFRILFGLFLVVVIAGAFWWVSTVIERFAGEAVRAKARSLVDAHLLEYHFNVMEHDPQLKDMVSQTSRDLQSQDYEARFLALDDTKSENVFRPEDPQEEEVLLRLRERLRQQQADEGDEANRVAEPNVSSPNAEPAPASSDARDLLPVFEERRLSPAGDTPDGEYHYYQTVYWMPSCVICHRALSVNSSADDGPSRVASHEALPFRVVKVSFRDNKTRQTIAITRATLLTAGIVTAFVTLTGTFIILRLAIVRPFARTSDDSDTIPSGDSNEP